MTIIEAHNLSKRYQIYEKKTKSIKEMVIRDWFRSRTKGEVWALKDLSFQIEEGTTLGIIGANGSGKSTLLKIISGITQPTSGEIHVRGKVASILELGAGFHPELSGLENIYLNGSILGLPKRKIDAALEEIISFAGMEKFIHLPVKHYSSGMLMRLGFSMAVHVDADILALDEVMAVGDSHFQEKSAKKIFEFKERGKTILLVTHNLDQAERVCDDILWLKGGMIKALGRMDKNLISYMRDYYDQKIQEPPLPFTVEYATMCPSGRLGSGEVLMHKVVVTDGEGREARTLYTDETMHIEMHYTARRPGMDLEAAIGIARFEGVGVLLEYSGDKFRNAPQTGVITAVFSPVILTAGRYLLSVALNPPGKPYEPFDMHMRFYEFKISARTKKSTKGIIKHPVRFELEEK